MSSVSSVAVPEYTSDNGIEKLNNDNRYNQWVPMKQMLSIISYHP